MLKGLLARQVFLGVDLILTAATVLIAYKLITCAIAQPATGSPSAGPSDMSSTAVGVDAATVEDRAHFAALAASGLFGDAGRAVGARVEEPEPVEQPEAKAPATLRLKGTTTGYPNESAVIEYAGARSVDKTQVYFLADAVTDTHLLAEVYPRKVVLVNTALNRREILEMDEETGAPDAPTPPGPPGGLARRTSTRPGHQTITRTELIREMRERGEDLVNQARPRMHYDADGNIDGITSDNLSNIPFARQAGLQSGDVVQSVNSVDITSEESLTEIVQRFQNSRVFRLGITRNGKPEMITIKVE